MDLNALPAYFLGLYVILGLMIGLWIISLILRDASIVDVIWGPGFGIAALAYFSATSGWPGRKLLIAGLAAVWALRLGGYLLWRNWGRGEDKRYQAWRRERGRSYWWYSFFQVFLLQGMLMWIISAPLLAAQYSPAPGYFTPFDVLGAAVWAAGLVFESVGDWQLSRFKANPANKGKVMDSGLWRYTRHPNYFGDALVWWGLFLIALSVPYGWITIFAPLIMTFLLVRVSGVSLLEKSLDKRPGYRNYVARTSAFVPWPPKSRPGGGRAAR